MNDMEDGAARLDRLTAQASPRTATMRAALEAARHAILLRDRERRTRRCG